MAETGGGRASAVSYRSTTQLRRKMKAIFLPLLVFSVLFSPTLPSRYDYFDFDDIGASFPCLDLRESCSDWASESNCTSLYMQHHCAKSCKLCHLVGKKLVPIAESFAHQDVDRSKEHVPVVGADLGVPQLVVYGQEKVIMEAVESARKYLDRITSEGNSDNLKESCQNHQSLCAHWMLLQNACTQHFSYMKVHCPLICGLCDTDEVYASS